MVATSREDVKLAAWVPGWYNLDQSLRAGQVEIFVIYQHTPELPDQPWLPRIPDVAFFNSLLSGEEWLKRRLRIISIRHPELGALSEIRTERFGVYEFVSVDGRVYEVEAEEDPGVCYDSSVSTSEWGTLVEVVEVAEPVVACR